MRWTMGRWAVTVTREGQSIASAIHARALGAVWPASIMIPFRLIPCRHAHHVHPLAPGDAAPARRRRTTPASKRLNRRLCSLMLTRLGRATARHHTLSSRCSPARPRGIDLTRSRCAAGRLDGRSSAAGGMARAPIMIAAERPGRRRPSWPDRGRPQAYLDGFTSLRQLALDRRPENHECRAGHLPALRGTGLIA